MRKGLLAVLFFLILMYAAYFQPKTKFSADAATSFDAEVLVEDVSGDSTIVEN